MNRIYCVLFGLNQDARENSLILSLDTTACKRHEEPTLHGFLNRKYWINLSKISCGSCLDNCLWAYSISKE